MLWNKWWFLFVFVTILAQFELCLSTTFLSYFKSVKSLVNIDYDVTITLHKNVGYSMQCASECLQRLSDCLAVVYINNYNKCIVILVTSSGVSNNEADVSYSVFTEKDRIYVNYNYDEMINQVKLLVSTTELSKTTTKYYGPQFQYPSSCIPSIPLPSSSYILLQQRVDGCLNFDKTWTEYVNGFGHPTGNYWAGLELIHSLTWSSPRRIRFEMKKFGDDTVYVAEYGSFKVGPSSDKYRLYVSDYDSGVSTVGDSITISYYPSSSGNIDNQQFSSKDVDNSGNSCSSSRGNCGWWMNNCCSANVNGLISSTKIMNDKNYITWYKLDDWNSIRSVKFVIQV